MTPRLARRAVAVALAFGVAADVLFDRRGLGINVPIFVAGILVATWLLRPRDRSIDRLDYWLAPVALLAAAVLATRTDATLVLLDGALAGLATLAWAIAASGESVTRRSALAVSALGAMAWAYVAIGSVSVVAKAGSDGSLGTAGVSARRALPVVRGLLIAVPIVAVFGILLVSADAVFAKVVGNLFALPIDLSDLGTRAVIVLGAAWAVGGILAVASAAVPVRFDELGISPSDVSGLAANAGIRVPRASTEALVVLVAVDALFAIFVVLQLAYLFGGLDTVAASGITYSNYAREGYFQLVAVVAGSGMLLAIAELAARGPEGRSRRFAVAAMALLGLTAVILVSAAVRLGLYQQIYGWTELRFYVATSIAWLAIAGVIATVLLIRARTTWLFHGLAFAAVAVTLGVSALGPQAYVTQQNLARALDASLVPAEGHSGFDAEYASSIGDDGIPALVDALPRLDATSRAALIPVLVRRRAELRGDAASAAWPAWNLARERARSALETLP